MRTRIAIAGIAIAVLGAGWLVYSVIYGNSLDSPPTCRGFKSCPSTYTNIAITPVNIGIGLLFGGLALFVLSRLVKHEIRAKGARY